MDLLFPKLTGGKGEEKIRHFSLEFKEFAQQARLSLYLV